MLGWCPDRPCNVGHHPRPWASLIAQWPRPAEMSTGKVLQVYRHVVGAVSGEDNTHAHRRHLSDCCQQGGVLFKWRR
ncbi:hypothetical protein Nepgr_012308 [Nepenthes gracilis]|uniref:Uncharacterized protein n=1 Tax=Nepenthes gracilis TaxID=150966 RepID=A0AAD3XMP6_NEPGR|nr:hypothetical protein Nepgr_012308 [Nepenthes gracilis]